MLTVRLFISHLMAVCRDVDCNVYFGQMVQIPSGEDRSVHRVDMTQMADRRWGGSS